MNCKAHLDDPLQFRVMSAAFFLQVTVGLPYLVGWIGNWGMYVVQIVFKLVFFPSLSVARHM